MATEERLIEANALQSKICGAKCGCEYEDCGCEGDCQFDFFISNAPIVDAVEVVHGRWIYEPVEFTYEKDIKCSICGSYAEHATNYCPNCGAKMDGCS